MTAHAHARRGIVGRLIRGRRPETRTQVPFPRLYVDEPIRQPAGTARQPWDTAEMPAVQATGRSAVDTLYADADLSSQRRRLADEHASWYSWNPAPGEERRVPPYAPEPEPDPVAAYPAPDLHADLRECPAFRDTVRACLVRREHARGGRHAGPWLQEYADVYQARTAPVAGFQFGGAS